MELVSPADHAQHATERAQDDMGEQFGAKQFMERHDSVTPGVMDKPDRSSADEYSREVSRLSVDGPGNKMPKKRSYSW